MRFVQLTWLLTALSCCAAMIHYQVPGETVIAVFAGLHNAGVSSELEGVKVDEMNNVAVCGNLSWRGVQQAVTAEWALDTINNQSQPQYRIGLEVLDTCNSPALAKQQLRNFLSNPHRQQPLLGVVSAAGVADTRALVPLLTQHSIPLLVTSAEVAYGLHDAPTLVAAVPLLETQMQAVVTTAGRLLLSGTTDGNQSSNIIGVVWSNERANRVFKTKALETGLVITLEEEIKYSNDSSDSIHEKLLKFATSLSLNLDDVVVLLLTVDEVRELTEGGEKYLRDALSNLRVQWLLAYVEDDPLIHELDILKIDRVLKDVVVVGPHAPHLKSLEAQLSDAVCSNHLPSSVNGTDTSGRHSTILSPLLRQYCSELHSQLSSASNSVEAMVKVDATHTGAVLRAVSSLTAAYRIIQLQHCEGEMVGCTESLKHDLSYKMAEGLEKLTNNVGDGVDKLRYIVDSRLSVTFSIVTVLQGELVQVGVFRENAGVEWLEEPVAQTTSRTPASGEYELSNPLVVQHPVHGLTPNSPDGWDSVESIIWWVVALCIMAALGLVCCLCLAVAVIIKPRDNIQSKIPNLLMLVGSIGVLMSSIIMITPVRASDTTVICTLEHILPFVSLTIIYAALLTKVVHLIANQSAKSHQIPSVVLYLPFVALVALSILLAALGDQTTLHLILPHEVSAVPAIPLNSIVSSSNPQDPLLTVTTIELCKNLDHIPALIGFIFLIILPVFATALLCVQNAKHEIQPEKHYLLWTNCASVPFILFWGLTCLYAPFEFKQPISPLLLNLLAFASLSYFIKPKLDDFLAKDAKQFSHRPLTLPTNISTVFSTKYGSTKSPTATPPVCFSARGAEIGSPLSEVPSQQRVREYWQCEPSRQHGNIEPLPRLQFSTQHTEQHRGFSKF